MSIVNPVVPRSSKIIPQRPTQAVKEVWERNGVMRWSSDAGSSGEVSVDGASACFPFVVGVSVNAGLRRGRRGRETHAVSIVFVVWPKTVLGMLCHRG